MFPGPSTSRCRPWTWRSPVDRWTQRRTQARTHKETNSKHKVNLKKNKTRESLSLIWAAYPDNAVEAVDGWEFKLQAEEVKWEDADYISLKRRTFTTAHNTSEITVSESHHLFQQTYWWNNVKILHHNKKSQQHEARSIRLLQQVEVELLFF